MAWNMENDSWLIEGDFLYPPAIISWVDGRIDILGVWTDRSMYTKHWDNSWSEWEPLEGDFTSPPAVVSWITKRLDVFALDKDGGMVHTAYGGDENIDNWDANWYLPDKGKFTSPPSVTSYRPNQLHVVALGTENEVQYTNYSNKEWAGSWSNLGGKFKSPPIITSWKENPRLDVFAVDANNTICHNTKDDDWSGWQPLDNSVIAESEPVAVASDQNRLDLFAVGADGALWHKQYVGTSWGDCKSLGGVCDSAPAAVSTKSNGVSVFCVSGVGVKFQRLEDGEWSGWKDLVGDFTFRF
jgi:hypothetical protein